MFGLLEQNISSERLLSDPALYGKIARNSLLSVREFCIWMAQAVWHSLVRMTDDDKMMMMMRMRMVRRRRRRRRIDD